LFFTHNIILVSLFRKGGGRAIEAKDKYLEKGKGYINFSILLAFVPNLKLIIWME
jgi:hypothetical protein